MPPRGRLGVRQASAKAPLGGHVTDIEIGAFLSGPRNPEQDALLRPLPSNGRCSCVHHCCLGWPLMGDCLSGILSELPGWSDAVRGRFVEESAAAAWRCGYKRNGAP